MLPTSPRLHVGPIGFAVFLHRTTLDQHRPKQVYLPRYSASAVGLPSGRPNVLNGSPPASTQHRRPVHPHVPPHVLCLPLGKGITSHPIRRLGKQESLLGFLYRVSQHKSLPRLRSWFHVKPAHDHCVGITAAPTSPRNPCCREWSATCISWRRLTCQRQPGRPSSLTHVPALRTVLSTCLDAALGAPNDAVSRT